MPDMVPVTSSNIQSVGYDPEVRELHVQFKDGGSYAFQGVSPEAHQAFVGASSVGSHFHQHIKGKYAHRRPEAA